MLRIMKHVVIFGVFIWMSNRKILHVMLFPAELDVLANIGLLQIVSMCGPETDKKLQDRKAKLGLR